MARTRPIRSAPPVEPEVMVINDIAVNCQVSKFGNYGFAQEARVPGRKGREHWRFRKTVIDEWLRGTKRSP